MLIPVLSIVVQLATPVADGIPQFDVRPSCREAARAGSALGRTLENCLESERRAQADLRRQWSQFPAADRAMCLAETRMGGPPTYSDYVTCLEMARDARSIPESTENPASRTTTGSGRSR